MPRIFDAFKQKTPEGRDKVSFWKSALKGAALYIALFGIFIIAVNLLTSVPQVDLNPSISLTVQNASISSPATEEQATPHPAPPNIEEAEKIVAVSSETVQDDLPHIAIIITGLGLKKTTTESVLQEIPQTFTLALSAYGDYSQFDNISNNILLEIPMETDSFPQQDPGPLALFDERPWVENVDRLKTITDNDISYVGFINAYGHRFLENEKNANQLFNWIHNQGKAFTVTSSIEQPNLNDMADSIKLPFMIIDMDLDDPPRTENILKQLSRLEEIAKKNGKAVATASSYPATLEILKKWSKNIQERGIRLSPITKVIGQQE